MFCFAPLGGGIEGENEAGIKREVQFSAALYVHLKYGHVHVKVRRNIKCHRGHEEVFSASIASF